MIDPRLILSDKDYVKRELAKKSFDVKMIDAIELILHDIRSQKAALNEMRREHNAMQRERPKSDPSTQPSGTETPKSATPYRDLERKQRGRITNAGKDLRNLEDHAQSLLLSVPNIPDAEAPAGSGGSSNRVLFESSDHHECQVPEPATHWHIAERLGILDPLSANKVSGQGFGFFQGKGAKLLRALVNYCMALHESKYHEMLPPHLVHSRALAHTGHLPRFASDQYKCESDDLWLIPTAEVPMTAAFAGTVFPKGALPKRYMAYTLAFRREAGATGKETRGLQRVHEFHKVELLKIVEPDMVQPELDDLLEDCLQIIKDLRLRYRVVDLCAGEMGDKYARCYDIEVYSPGVRKWLEVASVGHFSDYQARRANIKYIDGKGKKRTAYTLNGSGIAAARVWLSIIETYQQPDGTVKVPDVLVPFMGCEIIS